MLNPFQAAIMWAVFMSVLTPTAASARTYHVNDYGKYYVNRDGERVYVERYRNREDCRRKANKGTIIGGIGGALAGQAIGKNTTGTLVGAGVGAVAGHEIAKCKKR